MKHFERWIVFAAMATLAAMPVKAHDETLFDAPFARLAASLRADCESFENGIFDDSLARPLRVADFDRDGVTDLLVDEASFACSSAATLFSGGTGGGLIHVFVSGGGAGVSRFEVQGLAWEVVNFHETPVLLVAVHHSACDGNRPATCFAAYSWTGDGFAAAGGTLGQQVE